MQGKLINLCRLKDNILKANNILIISHVSPDPDTLGSALGLKWLFEKLNKTARIICDSKVNERICGFFNITPLLDEVNTETETFDYIICVDVASENMLGKSLEKYKNMIDLTIDHHYTNTFYARETYLDETAAATGEIIFNLIKELGIEIDREVAKYIYCAIICDSGSFKYPSTTPETMRAAAELIGTGFDFAGLNRLIFQNKSLEQIAIERLAYNSLKLYCDGRIAVINITCKLKKEAGLESVEIDGINELARIIAGVEVGVIIKEIDEEKLENKGIREFKISLRSNDYVNVAEIAAQFGGGGHMRAAGCKFNAEPNFYNPAEYIEQVLVTKIESVL